MNNELTCVQKKSFFREKKGQTVGFFFLVAKTDTLVIQYDFIMFIFNALLVFFIQKMYCCIYFYVNRNIRNDTFFC